MNAKRLWQIGGFLVVVIVLAVGWFLIISPGFETIEDNNSQRKTVEARNAQISADIANLSKVDVDALQQQLATRIQQIPEKLVEEDVFDEIKDYAAQAGVTVTSISISEPTAFATTQQSAEAQTAPTSAATASPTDGSTGIQAPGLPVTEADLAAANAAGMYDSTVSIAIDGGYPNARTFIDLLTQQSPRTFLVTGASLNGAGGAQTIDAVIWFKPRAQDLLSDDASGQ